MSFSLSTTAENTILDWLFNGTAAIPLPSENF